jgi:arginase
MNRLRHAATPIDVIRVPIALGADREGVDRGATELDVALRRRLTARGFPEILDRLSASVEITVVSRDAVVHDARLPGTALHVAAIASAAREVASAVGAAVLAGRFALVIGGDHALSIGSLAGAALGGRLGVIWIDAHGDINTPETSPSGHVHGMPLAAACGRGPEPLTRIGGQARLDLADLVYIGVRDLDPGERALLRDSPARVHTMSAIDERGLDDVICDTLAWFRARDVDRVHLSFDVDVLDPSIMPGTGTWVPGGLSYREAVRLLTQLRASDMPLVSADVVELNPLLDPSGCSTEVAAGLTAVLLGEILL